MAGHDLTTHGTSSSASNGIDLQFSGYSCLNIKRVNPERMVCLKREEGHSPSYRTTPCTELAVKLNIFVPSFFVHQLIQSILMIKQHLWTCFTWHISYWSLWLEVPAMPIALLSLKALIRLDCQPSTVTERRHPVSIMHDDVIKWKHFPRNWPFVQRPVTRSLFSLICVWINGWVNNREAGDLRRYRGYYDVSVMVL